MALNIPLQKTSLGQKAAPLLRPKQWLQTKSYLKTTITATTFIHALKKKTVIT